MRGITDESCTIAFVRKYGNNCVTYDLAEHEFEKELEKMSNEKKEKLDQLAKDMAEYQMEKEKKSSTKKSAPKKASTPKKNGNGKGRSGKKDSVRVQEVCETA